MENNALKHHRSLKKNSPAPIHRCYDYSLVIINYHTLLQLTTTLQSWLKFHSPAREKYEVIVWNNNSLPDKENQGLLKLAKQLSPRISIKILTQHQNLGFAQANNRAAKIAQGNYLIFLNADTLVIQNIWQPLSHLYTQLPHVGALAPQLLLADGQTPQKFASGDFPTLAKTLAQTAKKSSRHLSPSSASASTASQPRDWVSGACFLINRQIFQKIGGFDPQFFLYFEDVDLCQRLAQAGYQNYLAPKIKIIHLGGASFPQKQSSKQTRFYDNSQDLYFSKHFSSWQCWLLKLARHFYRTN